VFKAMLKLFGKKNIKKGLADIKNLPFTEVKLNWPESWWYLEHEIDLQKGIQEELNAEIGPRHPLWGHKPVVFAKCNNSDDILVQLIDGRFAIVHLVWHGHIDQEPEKFPASGIIANERELQSFLNDEI
jgi:hypothetical protein